MRVTNTMLIKDMLWNSNKNLSAMSKKQTEMSTGKRIQKPSDDPVGITRVIKYRTDIRESQQYQKNIDDALGWIEMSESSLTNIKDILQRMRELTVKAANGTNTGSDRQKIEAEVEQLKKEVLVSGNATNAGKYIFSGFDTDEKLFNDDGTYSIDMTADRVNNKGSLEYEVAVGEVLKAGIHPIDIFGSVQDNHFFDNLIVPNSSASTSAATRSQLTADVDLNYDYTGDAIAIQINSNTYTVDTTGLDHSMSNPMTKNRLIEALKQATDGTNQLGEMADIYFDTNDKLVVASKVYGSGEVITPTVTSSGLTGLSVTTGTDGGVGTITGSGNMSDAEVATDTGTYELVIQVDDKREKVSLNLSGINTVADFQTQLQANVNGAFSPAGTITINASDGSPLQINLAPTVDGQVHQLSFDYIKTNKSEMIEDINTLIEGLHTDNDDLLQTSLGNIDKHLDRVLSVLGEIGGKTNRIEYIKDRMKDNELTFTSQLSTIQDTDMAEAIMFFKNLENVYRASLSVGSKVIQPSLVDFIS